MSRDNRKADSQIAEQKTGADDAALLRPKLSPGGRGFLVFQSPRPAGAGLHSESPLPEGRGGVHFQSSSPSGRGRVRGTTFDSEFYVRRLSTIFASALLEPHPL